jgi:hypothetical protein
MLSQSNKNARVPNAKDDERLPLVWLVVIVLVLFLVLVVVEVALAVTVPHPRFKT